MLPVACGVAACLLMPPPKPVPCSIAHSGRCADLNSQTSAPSEDGAPLLGRPPSPLRAGRSGNRDQTILQLFETPSQRSRGRRWGGRSGIDFLVQPRVRAVPMNARLRSTVPRRKRASVPVCRRAGRRWAAPAFAPFSVSLLSVRSRRRVPQRHRIRSRSHPSLSSAIFAPSSRGRSAICLNHALSLPAKGGERFASAGRARTYR